MIIETDTLPNGAHRNQSDISVVPEGWAFVPQNITIPDTFPFVNIKFENQVVTEMTAGIVPEPEPETGHSFSETEQLRADVDYLALLMEVEL